MSPMARTRGARVLGQAATGMAAVALLFTLFATAEMGLIWREMRHSRPVDHPRLLALRADLDREPGADAIAEEIRRVEMDLRSRFLTGDRRLRQGSWLLLIGVATFAACVKLARSTRPRVPALAPRGPSHDPDRAPALFGRGSVLGVSLLLATTAVAIPVLWERGAEVEGARGIWARFRGAGGLGISPHAEAPLVLDAREGREENLRWRSVVPLPGLSSPVVWNERVFLTGATPNTREVYCFDALSGALLWRRPVSAGPESSRVPEGIWEETGYAAPTPVTDGARVWALFANGDVVCLDVFGQEIWCAHLGLPRTMYGLAASPLLLDRKLVLQVDQEWDDEGTASALIALDAADGSELWRTPRDVESSWPTPIPIQAPGGVQILTCANPFVIAYEPEGGTEVWRVDCLAGDGGPSPSFAEGLALVANVGSSLAAIRCDGEGDVTDTHIAWEHREDLPDVPSPLAADGLVWLQSTDGLTTCLELRTGEVLWEHDHEASFYSSPTLAGGRVNLIARKGAVNVIEAGPEYRSLAEGHLGEDCDTSPAFAEGRVYVRGRRHLLCFEGGGG